MLYVISFMFLSCVHNTDESDWDSDSASSQQSSPSKRMALPGLEDQHSSNSSAKEQEEGDSPEAAALSQRSIWSSREKSKSSPPVLHPQPSARKMVIEAKEVVEGKVLFDF